MPSYIYARHPVDNHIVRIDYLQSGYSERPLATTTTAECGLCSFDVEQAFFIGSMFGWTAKGAEPAHDWVQSSETVGEAATRLGLKSYDTALPQDWVNACMDQGFDPRGKFVVCYDTVTLGTLVPVTNDAARTIPSRLIW